MWSKQTDRSALNQNRREQLAVTKLIPYLGLHKKSINTWKVCNWMHNAKQEKKISLYKEEGTEETTAPAVWELIRSKVGAKKKEVGLMCVLVAEWS